MADNIIDTIFNFLADTLPQPLYSIAIKVLSHAFAAITAASTLLASLLNTSPQDWNLQTILPPLITLFAAYIALLSIYRTTTWFIRTVFFFVKWGGIIAALAAGAGYFMAQPGGGGGQVMPGIGGFLFNTLFNRNPTPASNPNNRAKRPKPWNSFQEHREWQYQEQATFQPTMNDADNFVRVVTETAKNAMDWWNGIVEDAQKTGNQARTRAKGKADRSGNTKARSR
ncbi:hypothetical protein CVT24_004136 [Panaeolus cyanescens]|uniref:Uncharacterized protein n=1 Tax=Panaeolus cyanescens TaxID=181874 RepID=A0A409Y607_9AGAR|nr:hypothetical protein CVT24_004136 [Panaeolus cyanescens]